MQDNLDRIKELSTDLDKLERYYRASRDRNGHQALYNLWYILLVEKHRMERMDYEQEQ